MKSVRGNARPICGGEGLKPKHRVPMDTRPAQAHNRGGGQQGEARRLKPFTPRRFLRPDIRNSEKAARAQEEFSPAGRLEERTAEVPRRST